MIKRHIESGGTKLEITPFDEGEKRGLMLCMTGETSAGEATDVEMSGVFNLEELKQAIAEAEKDLANGN